MKAADAVAKKAEEAMAADHARRHFEAEAAKKLGEAIELEEAWQRAEQARDLTEAAVQCLTKEKNEHTKKKRAYDRENNEHTKKKHERREKQLVAKRKWDAENREKILAYKCKWYVANAEQLAASQP